MTDKSPVSNVEKKRANWVWPEITDKGSAERAIKEALYCSLFCSAATFSLVLIGSMAIGAILDAVLFLGIAFGLHKKWRVAGIAGVTLFSIEKLYQYSNHGTSSNFLVALVLFFGFLAGARGTIAYHKFTNGTHPRPVLTSLPGPARLEALERLQKLREQGALTEAEFQDEKRKLFVA